MNRGRKDNVYAIAALNCYSQFPHHILSLTYMHVRSSILSFLATNAAANLLVRKEDGDGSDGNVRCTELRDSEEQGSNA